MNSPEDVIKLSLESLETTYHNEVSRIDGYIKNRNFTGGKLKIRFKDGYIEKVITALNIIYKARGWQKVNIWVDNKPDSYETVIELEYIPEYLSENQKS